LSAKFAEITSFSSVLLAEPSPVFVISLPVGGVLLFLDDAIENYSCMLELRYASPIDSKLNEY